MDRVLQLEAPDNEGTISFVGPDVNVRATLNGRTLHIRVQASHREGTSSWDEHDFEVQLPKLNRAKRSRR